MIAVLDCAQTRLADKGAASSLEPDELIHRAGAVVARQALKHMGGGYGRRVLVIAGPGNNGKDGLVAAHILRRREVQVVVHCTNSNSNSNSKVNAELPKLPSCDLVIDAAFGIGFHGEYQSPIELQGVPVLSIDIPTGVDADSGSACLGAIKADWTVTFTALKPGLCLGRGRELAGEVFVGDIGISTEAASTWVIEDRDVLAGLPKRSVEDHKWSSAIAVVAGSPGMMGAAMMCSEAAMRAGAGMVRLGIPGARTEDLPATEAVCEPLSVGSWAGEILPALKRVKAAVIGPGLGRLGGDSLAEQIHAIARSAPCPLVLDADALTSLGTFEEVGSLLSSRQGQSVLTPHWGEFVGLWGDRPMDADRISLVREAAKLSHSTVLLKGSTTVVCEPSGRTYLAMAGSARLATAGTGDVLCGVIAAFIARGLDVFEAAAFGAHVHGRASQLGYSDGLVAGDLPELVAKWLSAHPLEKDLSAFGGRIAG